MRDIVNILNSYWTKMVVRGCFLFKESTDVDEIRSGRFILGVNNLNKSLGWGEQSYLTSAV